MWYRHMFQSLHKMMLEKHVDEVQICKDAFNKILAQSRHGTALQK